MLPVLALWLGILASPPDGIAASGPVAVPSPGAVAPAPASAPDRVLLRLGPEAAALARQIPPARAARLERSDVPALDAAAARLPGIWFEREFTGEAPPPPGASLPDLTAFWIAHLPRDASLPRSIEVLAATPGIESAEPIAIVPVSAVPNDSLWNRAWYFYQASRRDLHAPEAWNVTTGDTSVVIAIVDTGVIPYHPDLGGSVAGLSGQIWTNWAEARGRPGVDDDGNGYVDDFHGWDFVHLGSSLDVLAGEDWRDPDNDPNDFAGHGTAVAGVAAALTNNAIGVSGVAWDSRIMPLRAGWASTLAPFGEVDLTFAARAIVYAARMGASAINCSFATVVQGDLEAAVTTAIAAGVTVVTAAGNNGSVHGLSDRDDVIAVASTDQEDRLALFSNRGSYVDLCAPGVSLATTLLARGGSDSLGSRQSSYGIDAAGTSFSAPLVAGAAALLQADRRARGLPPLAPLVLQMRLRETADDISGQNPTATGFGDGRLNLLRALTDPPTSIATHAGRRSVGSPVVIRGASGRDRVVFAMLSGQLLTLDGVSGDTLRMWTLSGTPLGGLAAADLGGGRGPGLFVASGAGILEGFDLDGNRLPGWPVPATLGYDGAPVEPALGDLDGDGELEAVWGGNDGYVTAWHADGRRVSGFPRRVGSPGRNVRIALSDFGGAPGVEIVAAAPSGAVHLLSGNGNEWPGWPIGVQAGPTSPVILNSPRAEGPLIVLAAGLFVEAWTPEADRRWSVTLTGQAGEGTAAGDLDGDGVDEIALTVLSSSRLVVLDEAGRPRSGGWNLGALPIGPPVIGPLRDGANGVFVAVGGGMSQAHVLAFTSSGLTAIGFPKPGRCGLALTLADLDADGRTEIVAGAGGDSVIYLYDAGRNSWSDSSAGWPAPRANFARTGSRLYTPAPPEFDDAPPALVSDLRADAVEARALTLRWTAPADPGPYGGAAEYDLRRARFPIDDGNFADGARITGLAAPARAGGADSARVTGLDENTGYWFALRCRDAAGNWSGTSGALAVTTSGDRPAAVRDLRVQVSSDTSLKLLWSATGGDGAQGRPRRYLVRGGPVAAGPPSFEGAPIRIEHEATVDAGRNETATVGGLERARRYWFALVAVDDKGNTSDLSNMISALTGPLGYRVGVALAAAAQPARAPVEIFWQGPAGASSSPQRIRVYDIGGRLRRTLDLPATDEGVVTWDGFDQSGRVMPAGLYFAQLSSGGFRAATRIALIR